MPTNECLVTIQNQSVGALIRWAENTSGQSNTFQLSAGMFYCVFKRVASQSYDTRALCLLTTSTPPLFLDDLARSDGLTSWFMIGGAAINLTDLYATLLEKVI